ncbi:MAG: sigma-70 family RNA polymerase sigma factor [Betaproteobacteria bacterium]|nr:sigma-70 family RNA polymerase sigma factor [Betaproteobacteria bacterium]
MQRNPGEPSDERLMLDWGAGANAAFEQLYARHKGGVLRYLLRQTGKRELAEELFQDVWLEVVNARAGYAARARFSAWIYSIAHNRLMDYFRAHFRAHLVSYEDETGLVEAQPTAAQGQPERTLERKQNAQILLRLLDTLPVAQREAFVPQQEGELSVEEIAAVTGVNRETAKSRLRYALAKLRAELARPS